MEHLSKESDEKFNLIRVQDGEVLTDSREKICPTLPAREMNSFDHRVG